jgi:hypothetical protein
MTEEYTQPSASSATSTRVLGCNRKEQEIDWFLRLGSPWCWDGLRLHSVLWDVLMWRKESVNLTHAAVQAGLWTHKFVLKPANRSQIHIRNTCYLSARVFSSLVQCAHDNWGYFFSGDFTVRMRSRVVVPQCAKAGRRVHADFSQTDAKPVSNLYSRSNPALFLSLTCLHLHPAPFRYLSIVGGAERRS